MTTPQATYTYDQLADRIEQALGERPSVSTLRAAASAARRAAGTRARSRITTGMPAPLPPAAKTAPAVFDADAVEHWLAHHPRRAYANAHETLHQALAAGGDPDQAVAAAREAGLSWRQITEVVSAHPGQPRSLNGVHKRYRPGN